MRAFSLRLGSAEWLVRPRWVRLSRERPRSIAYSYHFGAPNRCWREMRAAVVDPGPAAAPCGYTSFRQHPRKVVGRQICRYLPKVNGSPVMSSSTHSIELVAGETAPDVFGFPSPTLYFGLPAAAATRKNGILHFNKKQQDELWIVVPGPTQDNPWAVNHFSGNRPGGIRCSLYGLLHWL